MSTHFNTDYTGKTVKPLCGNKTATRASTKYSDLTCKKCETRLDELDAQEERDAYNDALRCWESLTR